MLFLLTLALDILPLQFVKFHLRAGNPRLLRKGTFYYPSIILDQVLVP